MFKQSILAFILAGLCSCGQFGKSPNSHHARTSLGTLIDAATLDASASTFSLTPEQIAGYGILALYFDHGNNAATKITLAMTCSPDRGTTDYAMQSCDVTSGVCTSSDSTWEKTVSADDEWFWRIDILGCDEVEGSVTDTGGGASDTLSVYGYAMDQ